MSQTTYKWWPPISEPYSWAGHCRSKVNAGPSDDEEKYANEADFHERLMVYEKKEGKLFGLKCKKQSTNPTLEFSKSYLHSLKPIKETYVYLRSESILQDVKLRRPRCVHLHSHPLRKMTSEAARKLRSLKNMKILSFRDYGFKIHWSYPENQDKKDLEEGGFILGSEDVLQSKELDYLLLSATSLRKLYVMLHCEDWRVFKRLQKYARRQKSLQGFGFISYCGKEYNYRYDISPLGPKLEHLELRFLTKGERVEMKGLNKLHQLRRFTYGTPYDIYFPEYYEFVNYPREEKKEDDIEEIDIWENETFWGPLVEQISQVSENRRFESLEIKDAELYGSSSKKYWNRILSILQAQGKNNVNVTFEVLLDSGGSCEALGKRIQEFINQVNFQGAVQFLILDNVSYIGGNHWVGFRLNNDRYNCVKQYLFEITKYKVKRILSCCKAE